MTQLGEAPWWEEPRRAFMLYLTTYCSQKTVKWVNWALKDFCQFGFPLAPPGSKEEVIGMMKRDLAPGCTVGTLRSYYDAVSWWMSWSRENISGCADLPHLGSESFGRQQYKYGRNKRNRKVNNDTAA